MTFLFYFNSIITHMACHASVNLVKLTKKANMVNDANSYRTKFVSFFFFLIRVKITTFKMLRGQKYT